MAHPKENSRNHLTMGGAPEGYDARLLLRELESGGASVLHIARDDKRMAQIHDALSFFCALHSRLQISGLGLPAL